MRYLLAVLALMTLGCGDDPLAPSRPPPGTTYPPDNTVFICTDATHTVVPCVLPFVDPYPDPDAVIRVFP